MFFGGNAGCADNRRQSVSGNPDDPLVLVFVIEQRCNRPDLDGVAGRKRTASTPEVATISFVGTIAAENLFRDADNDDAVEQSLGAEDSDFAALGIVAPRAIDIRACNDRQDRVGSADVRNAASPADLAFAVVE